MGHGAWNSDFARHSWCALLVVLTMLASASCERLRLNLNGLPCDSSRQCLDGYICRPDTLRCVPEIAVGCGTAGEICPSQTETHDPCPSIDAFLPCDHADARCDAGCRTCTKTGWSACSAALCELGTIASCARCTDDCRKVIKNATATCRNGAVRACDYTQCDAGFVDTDGDRGNGCEDICEETNGGIETCDGIDNDCNGVVDDDFDVGAACGIGACAGGTLECLPDGTDTRCSTMPGGSNDGSSEERCDGVDRDCDRSATNGFDVGTLCGRGACEGGVTECLPDGSGTRCSRMPGGSNDGSNEERCDGVDRDCDGSTTNGFDVGTLCGRGACEGGVTGCLPDGSGTRCSTMPGGSNDLSRPERCNDADDDCDGNIDDALGPACLCTDGSNSPRTTEYCGELGLGDGVDDTCNDAIDEGCGVIVPTNLGHLSICSGTERLRVDGSVTINTSNGAVSAEVAGAREVVSQGDGAPEIMVLFFTEVHVGIDAKLKVKGERALAIVACKDITIEGTIDGCARGRAAGPGGWAGGIAVEQKEGSRGEGPGGGGPGFVEPNGDWNRASGGGGGAFGGKGGAGGAGSADQDSRPGGDSGSRHGDDELAPLMGGSGGGSGGSYYGANEDGDEYGGGGGGALQLVAGGNLVVAGLGGIIACGAGGGESIPGWGGGGGGGAGGGILLEALTVTILGTVAANGGGGGGGDASDEETSGPSEVSVGRDGRFDAQAAAGGVGAAGTCEGCDAGNGGAGSGGSVLDGRDGGSALCGGGGGGGAGRIRINTPRTSSHLVVGTDAVLSPQFSAGVVRLHAF